MPERKAVQPIAELIDQRTCRQQRPLTYAARCASLDAAIRSPVPRRPAPSYFASEVAAACRAVQIFGSAVYRRLRDQHFYRDVRHIPASAGTTQISKLLIARNAITPRGLA